MKRNLLSLLLCLCLTFAMLLPMLSACNDNSGEQNTTEQPTSEQTEEPGASGSDTHSTEPPANTNTEPADTADQTTAPDTESDTASDTESDTEFDTESDTEQGTEPPPAEQSWTLPILRVNTTDGHDVTSKEHYKTCTVTLENCSEPMQFADVTANIRVRGNSTAVTEKKPFRLKFDKKRNMLGLNDGAKCKSWCLMADYYDYSLMRNSLSFRMCQQLLDGYSFASECTWVELYVNGDYRGVYLLCEQTQINPHRVDIYEKQDTETNLEIGYLMVGQGGRTDEPNTVQINYGGMPMTDLDGTTMSFGGGNFSLSSGGDYTREQIDFCSKVVGNIARICYFAIVENKYYKLDENWELVRKTDFTGTTDAEKQIETIAAYVDIESAVRMYMTDEIVKNLDSGTFNMYIDLSPDGARKLTFGPPWDFDFALANTRYGTTHSPKGLYAANFSVSDGMRVNTWYVLFCNAEWFREMCKPIWMEQREDLFAICESIPANAQQHKDAFDRNFDRWRVLGGINQGHQADDVLGFKEHMDAASFVYSWLTKRLIYLDTVWGDRVVTEDEEDKEFSHLDFSKADRSDLFDGYNSSEGTYSALGYFRLRIAGDGHDPYVHIKYEQNGAKLDADDYSVIEITYRTHASNSQAENSAEIFLCAGSFQNPTGGVSVHFDTVADGQWHTVRIPVGWSGEVHQLRLDFFNGGKPGDAFDLQSIILTN
ncbi:MAG: CotH kinase family protein [Clostridia bacterium]|nr:CotH kinase family protein [Clostridia bacterium]